MRHDNPAVYKCPKGKNALHTWKRNPDRTAICTKCSKALTVEQADDCWRDAS